MSSPSWTEYSECPVCKRYFDCQRPPVSLLCGHSLCLPCTNHLERRICPFDNIGFDIDVSKLPINLALLKLSTRVANSCGAVESGSKQSSAIEDLEQKQADALHERIQDESCTQFYLDSCRHMDAAADLLTPAVPVSTGSGPTNGCAAPLLTRPMHKKLAGLVQSQLFHEQGRSKFMRSARSVGERACMEMLLLYQSQHSLANDLWAAVKLRGGQFLGPVLQEQILKAVFVVMSPRPRRSLQRKTLVEFVVHRLDKKVFSTVSKTSVGHVIHLMYRASCFQIRKSNTEAQLSLQENIQSFQDFRREHDIQIARIAMEKGLHISPEYFSQLLYGTSQKRSHMQSIMDKLMTPEYFAQSVEELVIMAQKTGNAEAISRLRPKFKVIRELTQPEESGCIALEQVSEVLHAVVQVLEGLVAHPKFKTTLRVHNPASLKGGSEMMDPGRLSRGSAGTPSVGGSNEQPKMSLRNKQATFPNNGMPVCQSPEPSTVSRVYSGDRYDQQDTGQLIARCAAPVTRDARQTSHYYPAYQQTVQHPSAHCNAPMEPHGYGDSINRGAGAASGMRHDGAVYQAYQGVDASSRQQQYPVDPNQYQQPPYASNQASGMLWPGAMAGPNGWQMHRGHPGPMRPLSRQHDASSETEMVRNGESSQVPYSHSQGHVVPHHQMYVPAGPHPPPPPSAVQAMYPGSEYDARMVQTSEQHMPMYGAPSPAPWANMATPQGVSNPPSRHDMAATHAGLMGQRHAPIHHGSQQGVSDGGDLASDFHTLRM